MLDQKFATNDKIRTKPMFGMTQPVRPSVQLCFDHLLHLVTEIFDSPINFVVFDTASQLLKDSVDRSGLQLTPEQTWLTPFFRRAMLADDAPVVVNDVQTDCRFSNTFGAHGVSLAACVGIPIHREGAVIGALCTSDAHPRNWTTQEISHLNGFAAILEREAELRHCISAQQGKMNALSWARDQAVQASAQKLTASPRWHMKSGRR